MALALARYYGDLNAKKNAAGNDKAIADIPVVGKGAVTFEDIDKWVASNPDAQYFRIANGGNSVREPRAYTNKYGMWNDNDAAIVSQNSDKGARDIFRYMNISAADPRTGKRGEKATIGMQYSPGEFFAKNGLEYNTGYGQIYSLAEYGALKERVKATGKADWLTQYEKQAGERPAIEGATQEGPASKRRLQQMILGGDEDDLGGKTTILG